MEIVKKVLAKQLKCKAEDIDIVSPSSLTVTGYTQDIDIEFEKDGQKYQKTITVTADFVVK